MQYDSEIIVCKYEALEKININPIYYEVGKKLIEKKDPLLRDFIENKIRINKNILNKLEGKNSDLVSDRKAIINKKLEDLNSLLNE